MKTNADVKTAQRRVDRETTKSDGRGYSQEVIASIAHELWVARGCPEGSPEQDWFRALEQISEDDKRSQNTRAAAGRTARRTRTTK